MPNTAERRRASRGPIVIPVALTIDGERVDDAADLQDLSLAGARLRTAANAASGASARLAFGFDSVQSMGKLYAANGRVVRAEAGEIALELTELSADLEQFAAALTGGD